MFPSDWMSWWMQSSHLKPSKPKSEVGALCLIAMQMDKDLDDSRAYLKAQQHERSSFLEAKMLPLLRGCSQQLCWAVVSDLTHARLWQLPHWELETPVKSNDLWARQNWKWLQ